MKKIMKAFYFFLMVLFMAIFVWGTSACSPKSSADEKSKEVSTAQDGGQTAQDSGTIDQGNDIQDQGAVDQGNGVQDTGPADQGNGVRDTGPVDQGGNSNPEPAMEATTPDAGAPDNAVHETVAEQSSLPERPANHILLSGKVISFSGRFSKFTGAKVCVEGNLGGGTCATVDQNNGYKLYVPKNSDLYLTISGGSLYPIRYAYHSGAQDTNLDLATLNKVDVTYLEKGLQQINPKFKLDATKGIVGILVFTGDAGVSFSLVPKSGFGPIYFSKAGLPDPKATATKDHGPALVVNVNIASLIIKAKHASKTCTAHTNAISDSAGNAKLVPKAGWLTVTVFACK